MPAAHPLVLPFSDCSFDAVIAFKLYCYLPGRSLRERYIRELSRVLHTSGRLYMTHYIVPEADYESAIESLKEDE